jgi:hypothetical protein
MSDITYIQYGWKKLEFLKFMKKDLKVLQPREDPG